MTNYGSWKKLARSWNVPGTSNFTMLGWGTQRRRRHLIHSINVVITAAATAHYIRFIVSVNSRTKSRNELESIFSRFGSREVPWYHKFVHLYAILLVRLRVYARRQRQSNRVSFTTIVYSIPSVSVGRAVRPQQIGIQFSVHKASWIAVDWVGHTSHVFMSFMFECVF